MDLPSLMAELQLRGLGQDKVDSAFRCLVHVHAVQDHASEEKSGILAEDIIGTYPIEVVQAATELFLEKSKFGGQFVYRVRWGCEDAATVMQDQLWENSSTRWNEFVSNINDRYLGFLMPQSPISAREITGWKSRKDLQWFSGATPRHGWNLMRIIDDMVEVAWSLDLAFGFRPYGANGVENERVLLHERAFEALRHRASNPPEGFRKSIGLWRFFSEYDVESTDFVRLMQGCGLTLDDVAEQVDLFFAKNLTTKYRDAQYPPYFVNQKMKKEFEAEVKQLLAPLDVWLTGAMPQVAEVSLEVLGSDREAEASGESLPAPI